MESPQMSDRASQFVKSQLDQVRFWFVHCSEHVGAMLSAKDSDTNSQDKPDDSLNLVSNFESFLVEFQSLLIWENPYNSAFALTMFTCFYWLVVMWSPRIFSIIAIIFFCYHFYEMWTRYVWPEIRVPSAETKENWTSVNPNVLSAPEIQTYLEKLKNLFVIFFGEIADLRRRSHGTFCFISISLLLVFYYLGRNIPGVIFVYFFAIFLFLTPGFLLHVLPNHMLDAIIDYCNSFVASTSQENDKIINLENKDLDQEKNIKEFTPDRSESPRFNSQFYENFFASGKSSTSTSDISDDFEIISETDLGEMNFK